MPWPGIQQDHPVLSYGHDGSGLFLPSKDFARPWIFARTHGLGRKYRDILSQSTLSPGVKLATEEMGQNKDMRNVLRWSVSDSYFPMRLVSGYASESNNIMAPTGYDPLVGDLITKGRIAARRPKDQDDKTIGIVYVNNKSNSVLTVGVMGEDVRGVSRGNELIGQLAVPISVNPSSIEMVSSIKQIQMAGSEPSVCPYLLVRTGFGTTLVKCDQSKRGIRLQKTLEIPCEQEGQSHSTFSHWNWIYLATISTTGRWSVYTIEAGGSRVVKTLQGSIPPALKAKSVWHKVFFGGEPHILWIANRRGIFSIDLTNSTGGVVHNIVPILEYSAEDKENRLQDVIVSPNDPTQIFVLTAKTVSWIDTKTPSRPLLSWEHDLSMKDPSLRLSASTIDRIKQVCIHSQLTPAIIVYQFADTDGMPVSADDPYYAAWRTDSVAQSILSFPLTFTPSIDEEPASDSIPPEFLVNLSVSTDFGLRRQILCTDQLCRVQTDPGDIENDSDLEDDILSQSDDIYPYEVGFRFGPPADTHYMDLRPIYGYLFGPGAVDQICGGEQSLKDYAIELGSSISTAFETGQRSISTLAELCPPKNSFQNLDELSNMINQLADHYKDTDIELIDVKFGSTTLFEDQLMQSIGNINDYLLSLWLDPLKNNQDIPTSLRLKRHKLCTHIAWQLALSCMGVCFRRDVEKRGALSVVQKYIDSGIKPLKPKGSVETLLDEWNDDGIDNYQWHQFGRQEEDIGFSQGRRSDAPQNWTLSGTPTRMKSKSPRKMPAAIEEEPNIASTSMAPPSYSQTAMSYSTTTASQSSQRGARQSQAKKKKKRAEGFA